MEPASLSLFSEIKYYLKLSKELQIRLAENPDDWPRFQEIFNLTVDRVYHDIMKFEKMNIVKSEAKVYKFRKIFEKRYKRHFLYGEFANWSHKKPFGYAGDFKIIDEIYKEQAHTTGFERLWDNYFLQMAASRATRERKEDFKGIILDFVKQHQNQNIRIMNLASGPAREIKELLDADKEKLFAKVIFDCLDFDMNALDYAKKLLNNPSHVNFLQKNAIRIALKKDVKQEVPYSYDLIYATGLFDYLDERVAVRLAANLKKLLKAGGLMAAANMRDKYSNSSACLMEWVTEWFLIYRTEAEFKKIFINAGFAPEDLQIIPQKSKIMQYCLAGVK